MKIIRLEPDKKYGPFPRYVLLVSNVPFVPRIALSWDFYTINGVQWRMLDKPERAFILIGNNNEIEKSYLVRTYKFVFDEYYHRYELI